MKKFLINLSMVILVCAPLGGYAKGGNFHMSPETEVQNSSERIQQVQAAYYTWVKDLAEAKGNPKHVVKLYASDAILLPTLSDKIKFNNKDQLAPYFEKLTSYNQLNVETTLLKTFVSNDVAVNTGTYTFSYMSPDNKLVELPARFTFVYKLKGDKTWLILTHHSSALPGE